VSTIKKFIIKCQSCGSEDVDILTDTDYGFDGEDEYLIELGQYFCCNNCGETDDV
jgi:hypothetical protein